VIRLRMIAPMSVAMAASLWLLVIRGEAVGFRNGTQ
jgi:hypothetical protein